MCDPHNPLLRRTVLAVWPVSIVGTKTATTFADNIVLTLSYAPQVAWVHLASLTQPGLDNMAAYHSSRKAYCVAAHTSLLYPHL